MDQLRTHIIVIKFSYQKKQYLKIWISLGYKTLINWDKSMLIYN